MFVCVCMYIRMSVCMCMYVYTYVCMCMYVYTYVCMYVYVCIYVCRYVYVCMYIRMYVCDHSKCRPLSACIYIYTCIYVYVCIYVCMYVCDNGRMHITKWYVCSGDTAQTIASGVCFRFDDLKCLFQVIIHVCMCVCMPVYVHYMHTRIGHCKQRLFYVHA